MTNDREKEPDTNEHENFGPRPLDKVEMVVLEHLLRPAILWAFERRMSFNDVMMVARMVSIHHGRLEKNWDLKTLADQFFETSPRQLHNYQQELIDLFGVTLEEESLDQDFSQLQEDIKYLCRIEPVTSFRLYQKLQKIEQQRWRGKVLSLLLCARDFRSWFESLEAFVMEHRLSNESRWQKLSFEQQLASCVADASTSRVLITGISKLLEEPPMPRDTNAQPPRTFDAAEDILGALRAHLTALRVRESFEDYRERYWGGIEDVSELETLLAEMIEDGRLRYMLTPEERGNNKAHYVTPEIIRHASGRMREQSTLLNYCAKLGRNLYALVSGRYAELDEGSAADAHMARTVSFRIHPSYLERKWASRSRSREKPVNRIEQIFQYVMMELVSIEQESDNLQEQLTRQSIGNLEEAEDKAQESESYQLTLFWHPRQK